MIPINSHRNIQAEISSSTFSDETFNDRQLLIINTNVRRFLDTAKNLTNYKPKTAFSCLRFQTFNIFVAYPTDLRVSCSSSIHNKLTALSFFFVVFSDHCCKRAAMSHLSLNKFRSNNEEVSSYVIGISNLSSILEVWFAFQTETRQCSVIT